MNSLFEFDGQHISVNPILLSIKPFEQIWKRDKSKIKEKARKELIYIYGMVSTNDDNIWKDYVDLKKREDIIIEDLFGKNSDWTPDRLVLEAIDKYRARYPKTPAEMLLETAMKAMMKVKDHLDSIDLNERDNQGRLIHNPKIVLDVGKMTVKTYMEIEDAIEKIKANKKLNADKIRGGSEEGIFESPDTVDDLI